MLTRLVVRIALALCTSLPLAAHAAAFTGLYVLGDSLSDQGNLFAATTALGLSRGIAAVPAADHYYAGRFANGENYAGDLGQRLGLNLTTSLSGGNNFAFGGTRTNYNVVEAPPFGEGSYPRSAYDWSLNLQRAAFESRVASVGADPTALYVVFSGANDMGDVLRRRLNPATTIAGAVEGIHAAIEAFKSAGAQTVLVPNLPDLGLVPRFLSLEPVIPGISALATALTAQYNAALELMLRNESGIRVIRFDTFDFIEEVVASPARFGFANASAPCYSGFVDPNPTATVCASPDSYVFWDSEHPTAALHSLLADRLVGAISVPEPSGTALVALGFLMLAVAGRVGRGRRSA